MPYADHQVKRILQPLGMKDTTPWLPEAERGKRLATGYGRRKREGEREPLRFFQTDAIAPAAGYASTALDLARFAGWQLGLLEKGGKDVIAASTLREMQHVHWMDPDWKTSWGLGFSVWRYGDTTMVGHGGSCPGYRTEVAIAPADDFGVAYLSNAIDGPTKIFTQGAYDLVAPALKKMDERGKDATGCRRQERDRRRRCRRGHRRHASDLRRLALRRHLRVVVERGGHRALGGRPRHPRAAHRDAAQEPREAAARQRRHLPPRARRRRAGRDRGVRARCRGQGGARGSPRQFDGEDAVSLAVEQASPPIDQVGVEERVARLRTRSIKKDSKQQALELALSMIDLTTLEGADSTGQGAPALRQGAAAPPVDARSAAVAAVCVYSAMVAEAKRGVEGTGIKVAAVATGFPAGQVPLEAKLLDTRYAVEEGADEIDMVISRGRFLAGDESYVFDEIAQVKEACGPAHLKVILETGELGPLDRVRRASDLAMAAGADFIKTSTGKVQPAATMEVTLVMLEAIRDFYYATGKRIGMKPAGGISKAKLALQYLVMVRETLGQDWLTPDLFRFGASSLANDLLMQIEKQRTGRYSSPGYFSLD